MNVEECWANIFWAVCAAAVICTVVTQAAGCTKEHQRLQAGWNAEGDWKPGLTPPLVLDKPEK
jgi:hypothetical protein